jgi:FlaA1/EpsC-like NDP-sugar epimerase
MGFRIKLSTMQNQLRNLPRLSKQIIAAVFDVAAAWLTLWTAFALQFETLFWPSGSQASLFIVSPLLAIPFFIRFGLYLAVIRYTGLLALQTIAKAITVYGLIFAALIFTLRPEGVPRSIGILQPLLFLILIAVSRALGRFWFNVDRAVSKSSAERLIIYGAGAVGIQIAHALHHAKHYQIIGFMDDDASLQGKTINGWRVFRPQELDQLIEREGVQGVLLALPSIPPARRLEIVELLRRRGLHVRSLPSLSDLASGMVSMGDIQELDADDLLGRTAITPDSLLMSKNITGKTVMVTGAGGSIGSELCRQILAQKPSQLLLLDHSEFGLYAIHHELQARKDISVNTQLIPLLASVRDEIRLKAIFEAWKPYTVYHAAAYKHVPMVEHNVAEGAATNILGTLNAAQAALAAGVHHFVLISTDKAVRPTNVMGATKRVAELVLQALAAHATSVGDAQTVFTMVRFGNVLDSSGSVVPLFRRQIKDGGPVTLTHPEVTRYFMTIPEAAQLVIQAAAMAKGGEVFVLDMGEPVKILDLARRMIELSGFAVQDIDHPDGDIEIKITGLRPGEKLYEELLIGNEPKPSQHVRIMMASESFIDWFELSRCISQLQKNIVTNQVFEVRKLLSQLVDGYSNNSPVVDWLANLNAKHLAFD